jgi:hypothetical protein
MKQLKCNVYLDINNLFHRYKKLDFIKLKEWIASKYEIIRMNAYNSIDHTNQNQIKFNTYLSNNGYRVEDPDVNVMSNIDPILTTQLLAESNVMDHNVIVLVACDGKAYAYPLNELAKCGYKIHTIGCRDNTGLDLLKVSDLITYLEDIEGVINDKNAQEK